MRYCQSCGQQLDDDAAFCPKCGSPTGSNTVLHHDVYEGYKDESSLNTAIKVFFIIGCVISGFSILPLIWCIPMTIYVFRRLNTGTHIGLWFKICSLIFVSLIGGILILFRHETYRDIYPG